MNWKLTKIAILITVIIAPNFIADPARGQDFSRIDTVLYTSDGFAVGGTCYFVDGTRGPAVMLLHMLGGDRSQWEPYLPLLSKAGVTSILAVDLRGHGKSNRRIIDEKADSTVVVSWRDFTETEFKNAVVDLETAWSFLKSRPSTDTTRMGVMGASIGANYAAIFASNHPDVKSLALLSPGVIYRGVGCEQAIVNYGKRAVLFAAAKDDSYSAGSCRELKQLSTGSPAHIEIYKGDSHGTRLIDNNPEFEHFLSDWFLSTL